MKAMGAKAGLIVIAVCLCLIGTAGDSRAESIILDSPYEDYSTHTVESLFGQNNWDYQQIGVNIHIGRLFAWEERGLARFNTTMIPDGAQVEEVILHVTVIQNTLDPTTLMDVTSLYVFPTADNANDVANSMGTVYADDLTTMLFNGNHTIVLSAEAIWDLQAALDDGQNWFGVGFTGTNDGDYTDGIIEGYNGYFPPYLEVIYTGDPPYAEMHITGNTSSVPAAGGPLSYTVNFQYGLSYPTPGLAYWAMVDGYSGTMYGPVYYQGFTAQPGMNISYPITHQVPGSFEPGTHNFIGYIGYYPNAILSDAFAFLKFFSATDQTGDNASEEWTTEGGFVVETAGEAEGGKTLPDEYAMQAAYPNPFNASTTVTVTLPDKSELTVVAYNVAGQQVALMVNGQFNAGQLELTFDASDLASGLYFIRVTVPGQLDATQKVMLIR